MVYNKTDLVKTEPRVDRDEQGKPTRVWLSAHTAEGLDLLSEVLTEIFRHHKHHGWIMLQPQEAALRDASTWREEVFAPVDRLRDSLRTDLPSVELIDDE